MGQRYFIDSNTIIYFTENNLPEKCAIELQKILNDESNISFISRIECLAFPKISPQQELKFKTFISNSNVYIVHEAIIEKTIELKRKTNMKLPDAIIAATSLVYNFTLITRNERDFIKISGLKIVNPFNLG
ncbi:MAG: type II toxin-antitoxin system VapC family toxin [Bacteroidia bacterium]